MSVCERERERDDMTEVTGARMVNKDIQQIGDRRWTGEGIPSRQPNSTNSKPLQDPLPAKLAS